MNRDYSDLIKLLDMPADQLKATTFNPLNVLAEKAALDLASQGLCLSSVERLDYDICTSQLSTTLKVFKHPTKE